MFNRFSMFTSSGNHVVLRPLCFGKLPLSRDFLKSRGGDASRFFQEWINALDRLSEPSAILPYSQRVLFVPQGGSHFVVASVWNSSDEGGGRVFPFSLYFETPRKFLEANRKQSVIASLKLWRFLEKEQKELAGATSTAEFYRRLRQLSFAVSLWDELDGEDLRVREEAASVSVRDLAEGLFGKEPVDDWVRLLWRLSLALRSARGTSNRIETLALRLPLARNLSYALQIDSWLRWMRKRAEGRSLVPSVILPMSPVEGPANFAVYFRPLWESDVLLLHGKPGKSDVLDLTVPDPDVDVSGYSDFQRAVVQWLDQSEANLRNIFPDVRRTANGSFT